MSTAIFKQRFKADQSASSPALHVRLWQGRATRFEVGLFNGAAIADITDIVSLNLRVKASQSDTGASLMSATVLAASLNVITVPQWTAGTHEAAVFTFTNAECNLAVAGVSQNYWLAVTALLTSGSIVPFGCGQLTVMRDNADAVGNPPENPDPALSLSDTDARYVRHDEAQELDEEAQLQALSNLGITITATRLTLPGGGFIFINKPNS